MFLCSLWVVLFAGSYGYYLIDQVSFPVPLLRCRNKRVLFYCHHPDKLLSTDRASCIKRAYRFPLDLTEELTTGMSHTILVNSLYTQQVFLDAFPLIQKCKCCRVKPQVLYPAINEKNFIKSPDFNKLSLTDLVGVREDHSQMPIKPRILTSLNRYERKKDINLALRAFSHLLKNANKE